MSVFAVCLSLFVAGITSSLHCAGMCGPLVLAIAQIDARRGAAPVGGRVLGFAAYHAGRVWTYALLGLAAGALGADAARRSAALGWARPIGLAVAAGVIAAGAWQLLRGGPAASGALGRAVAGLGVAGGFRALAALPGPLARFLLGAILGLIPCGLLYATLAVAASLQSAAGGALAMTAFALGTVPSLGAAVVASHRLRFGIPVVASRMAAVALIAAGALVAVRALARSPGGEGNCPVCASPGETAAAR